MAINVPNIGQTPWGTELNGVLNVLDGQAIAAAGFDASRRLRLTRGDGTVVDAGVMPLPAASTVSETTIKGYADERITARVPAMISTDVTAALATAASNATATADAQITARVPAMISTDVTAALATAASNATATADSRITARVPAMIADALDGSGTGSGIVTLHVDSFGAVGDGTTNDAPAVRDALASVPAGLGIALEFGPKPYRLDGELQIPRANVSIKGQGVGVTRLIMDRGFRHSYGNFSASDMSLEASVYSSSNRGFSFNTPASGLTQNIGNFSFFNLDFKGFFYSTDFRSAEYSTASSPMWTPAAKLTGIRIVNVTSTAPSPGVGTAGHFQHIATRDVVIANCSTYGGSGASSYNFIGRNELIRITGCYDQNNTYGSVEIENGTHDVVISGNVFGSIVWVDDSDTVTITGNTCLSQVLVTAQTFGCEDITISGNTVHRIRVAEFGTNPNVSLGIDNVNICDNIVNGNTTNGILLEGGTGMLRAIWVHGNLVRGAFSNSSVAVIRGADFSPVVNNNRFTNGKTVIVSGSGGTTPVVENNYQG